MDPLQNLTSLLQDALKELGLPEGEILLEPTEDSKHGDYSCNVAMQLFAFLDKQTWGSPRDVSQAIVDKLHAAPTTPYISSVTVAGPGFINFTLSDYYFTTILHDISSGKTEKPNLGNGVTAIVEFSSPNIAKPFTVGHLRSTIIGDAVAKILSEVGFEVKTDNHLGDWGTQFGKLIVAIKAWGNIEDIENSKDPVKELVALYVRFHEEAEKDASLEDEARKWFMKLEQGDVEARELWQKCIDWSWIEFNRIYEELEVHFTENHGRGYGESFFEDKMQSVIEELEKSGYLQEGKERAKLFFFPKEELPPLMILKKDGSTLYSTRDLATDKFRLETYGSDILIINEVGSEQELYFRQIFRIEELLGWTKPGQRVHVKHGHFRFQDSKMSTRKGNVIWLQDVIEEAKNRALSLAQADKQLTEQDISRIAIGALKWNDLKRASQHDVLFDWDQILNMQGNSGPYLQYTAVRAGSVLHRAEQTEARGKGQEENEVLRVQGSGFSKIQTQEPETAYEFNPEERELVRQLSTYPLALKRAALEYSPHYLATSLYTLASRFNSFYNTHNILGDSENLEKRLELTKSVQITLKAGLQLLGIEVPDKM